MTKPLLSVEDGRYTFTWEDSGWVVEFYSLYETSKEVKGHIWVRTVDGGHVVRNTFNLSSLVTRKSQTTELSNRTEVKFEIWRDMLEYCCIHTIDEFTKGEPFTNLGDAEAITEVEYLIYPMAPYSETISIAADGDSGKSWIALAMLLSVRLGIEVIPGFQPKYQGDVMYLDWETSEHEMRRRLELLCRGLGVQRPSILYRHMSRPIADEIAFIRREVTQRSVAMVVVDSAGPAAGGELNEAEPAIRMMSALRTLDPASRLVIGHVSKGTANANGSTRGRMYGSVFFENLARSCWEVRSDTDSSPVTISLIHRKANMGKKVRPMAVYLQFDDVNHTAIFKPACVADHAELVGEAAQREQIIASLRHGHRSTSELAEDIGATESQVRTLTSRMKDTVVRLPGASAKGGRGNQAIWGLAALTDREGVS